MKWRNAWLAAFVLPVLCSSAVFPQQTSDQQANPASSDASVETVAGRDVLNGAIANEDQIRQALTGKLLYLRGLWLSDDLHFNMRGALSSPSPTGSFTLCAVEIDHVRMTKRRVELEGVRYGIHFVDATNWANEASSFDLIRVTPKKKHLVIAIDRQLVETPKKKKEKAAPTTAKSDAGANGTEAAAAPASDAPNPAPPPQEQAAVSDPQTEKDQIDAPTTDPRQAAALLRSAFNRIFAPALDATMIAQMPDYWQYFYQAQKDHHSMEPTDPAIVRPGPGVDGPKLVKNLVATSNDYAQRSEVAGVASYKVILDPQGKPIGVAVYRPIGFGLDENAVNAIRKSTFTGATKDGKPVSTVIDMWVNFRIYSKRTSPTSPSTVQTAPDASASNISPVTGKPSLAGPYSAARAFADSQQPQETTAPQPVEPQPPQATPAQSAVDPQPQSTPQ